MVSSGCKVVVYVVMVEGMWRVMLVGVVSIEYGDGGIVEVFVLMVEKGVLFCLIIVVGDVIS